MKNRVELITVIIHDYCIIFAHHKRHDSGLIEVYQLLSPVLSFFLFSSTTTDSAVPKIYYIRNVFHFFFVVFFCYLQVARPRPPRRLPRDRQTARPNRVEYFRTTRISSGNHRLFYIVVRMKIN